MVKKGILLLTAVAAFIFGAFFLLRGYAPLEIGVEENGGEATLHAPSRFLLGQTLILTLESNPTTGYSWQPPEFDEAVLKLLKYVYVPRERAPDHMGVGGEAIWYFQAQSPGSTTLHLEYVRPWEEGVEPARTFTVQVVVK